MEFYYSMCYFPIKGADLTSSVFDKGDIPAIDVTIS